MNDNNRDIAQRLKGLREMLNVGAEELASVAGVDIDEYLSFETGEKDFSVTFLFNCAERLGVDVTELLTGTTPTLSLCSIVRAGQGIVTTREHMFTYEHLANHFKGRTAEPFLVTAPFDEEAANKPIVLSTHKGQEIDYILDGQLKINVNGRTTILKAGDTAYYDSAQPHGMVAVGGKDCKFVAVVLKHLED